MQTAMTSFELGNLIKDRLAAAGLAQYLDEAKEQYLEFPDGFFAEVVLKDGAKLSEAQRIVKSIEEELRKQGVELDAIVRRKIASIKRGVVEGSNEWSLLYKRYRDEEMRKKGPQR